VRVDLIAVCQDALDGEDVDAQLVPVIAAIAEALREELADVPVITAG